MVERVHEGIHERIQKACQKIDKDPRNAQLYLQRAELYRLHLDWPEARADLNLARRLTPQSAALLLEEAHWFAARGRRLQALMNLDAMLDSDAAKSSQGAVQPNRQQQAEGWRLRAELLRQIKQPQAAADAMAQAIPLFVKAEPDYFHFRAKCLLQLGHRGLQPALDCAQQGIDVLGACISLELLAVDIECRLGRCDSAIERLKRISHNAQRKESWLVQMGDVYWRCGRRAEAKKQYRSALNAIQRLRPRTQNTPAVKELRSKAESQLAMLAS